MKSGIAPHATDAMRGRPITYSDARLDDHGGTLKPSQQHRRRRLIAILGAGLMAATSGIVAGGSAAAPATTTQATSGTFGTGAFAACVTAPSTCNSGRRRVGGTLRYTLERTIQGWNINYTLSNVFETGEVEDGIMPTVFNSRPNFRTFLNTDLMRSVTSRMRSGTQVITYHVRRSAVWNDGAPIGYADFRYMWNFSDPSRCPLCNPASSVGYDRIASMRSTDRGKTIIVRMARPFADWRMLFGALMPAHIASRHGYNGTARGTNASFHWFDRNVPHWSGGPMVITRYRRDASVTEKPNPKWYGATRSRLDSLVYRIITDQTQEPNALQFGNVDVIYPSPNAGLVNAVSGISGVQYWIGKGLIWEHFNLNERNRFLKNKALRKAIFTAIDRQNIVDQTIGTYVPGATTLGNHMFVPGQPGYHDNVTPTGLGAGDIAAAEQILTSAGYTGVGSALTTPGGVAVTLRCTYSEGNPTRQTECLMLKSTLNQLGITVHLKTTADLSELGTGNYDIIVFAWVGSPYAAAGAQQVYTLHGGAAAAYTYNNDPTAERLINRAARTTDQVRMRQLLDQADVRLEADCFELPLYQKPTLLAARKNVVNLRDNPTSVGPPYNVQEWGLKPR
jgi:peptide/nickel transport system substrate-binding protein